MFVSERVIVESVKKILDGIPQREKDKLETLINSLDFSRIPSKAG
jgi:hypothetical protein